jgi:hypothetical protein
LSGTHTGFYPLQHNPYFKSKLKTYNLILDGITESPGKFTTTKDFLPYTANSLENNRNLKTPSNLELSE